MPIPPRRRRAAAHQQDVDTESGNRLCTKLAQAEFGRSDGLCEGLPLFARSDADTDRAVRIHVRDARDDRDTARAAAQKAHAEEGGAVEGRGGKGGI